MTTRTSMLPGRAHALQPPDRPVPRWCPPPTITPVRTLHFHPTVGLPSHYRALTVPFLLEPLTDRMALDATDDAADSSAAVLTTMAVLNPYDAMAQDYPSLDLGKNSNLCFAFLHDQM